MRKIAIIGAGQSGLQLALGLQHHGYDVTLVSNRTAEQLREGRVMSSQCMFGTSLAGERELGLDFWADECPDIEGIGLTVVGPDGGKAIEWEARLDTPAQSVDQRVKMRGWMIEFQRRGGRLELADAGVGDLDDLAERNELVIVASGKGEVGRLFARDESRSPYDAPQRSLALTYVNGMQERESYPAVAFNLIPGVGEYFWFPALTTSGPCHIMVFEAIPGGPMDCWGDVKGPEDHLERSRSILEQFLPWEAERARGLTLTDPNGVLAGRFAPTVRRPVAELPSGLCLWGMADTVVLNDPITGQGSNNAAKCADVYLKAILARENEPFDRDWMEATFESYWDYAGKVVRWTNLLLAPPEPHVVELLGAAEELPGVAGRIVNGFDNPPDFFPWWENAGAARELLHRESAAASA
jgi:hypothetical protein